MLSQAAQANKDLNAKVERIVSRSTADKAEPQEYEMVRDRMRSQGPNIYQNRSRLLTCTAMLVSLGTMALAPSAIYFAILVVAMYFYADFYSGLLHVNLDNRSWLTMPFFKDACLEFQWHHLIPNDISKRHLLDAIGDLNLVMTLRFFLFGATVHFLMPSKLALPINYYWTTFGVSLFMAFLNQYGHRQAHTPLSQRPRWVVWAQNNSLLLPPLVHLAHHNGVDAEEFPHGTSFPVFHGNSASVLQRLLELLPYERFWFATFFLFSIVDIVVMTHVVYALANNVRAQ